MGRLLATLLLSMFAAVAAAQSKDALRLDVAGEVAIDKTGSVYDYQIKTLLTPEVKAVVDRAVRSWKFEPVVVDGEPVYAKNGMRLSLLASRVDAGYRLRVERVRFSGSRKAKNMAPPKYPKAAQRAALSATVLMAVRIDERGEVTDAVAAQSSLDGVRANKKVSESWLKEFEAVSLAAAKKWKFEPVDPASGGAKVTTQLVPVEFRIDSPSSLEGWRYASTGTYKPIPWLPAEEQAYDATGLKQGESLALDGGFKLKQDVVGKAL